MVEASIATITNITLNQTVDINGNLEPCHFLEFDSDLQYKTIPGDDTGIPSGRVKFLQQANRYSRATVPPLDGLGLGKPVEILEVNRTGSIVNGVPAWGIAVARWTNSPSPAPTIGDEVQFVGNTNTVPLQNQLVTGCTAAEIQSTLITYEDFAEAYSYDVWLNTRFPGTAIATAILDGNNTFTGNNLHEGIETFEKLNIPTNAGNPNGSIDGTSIGLTAGGVLKDTVNNIFWTYSGASTVWYNAFGSISSSPALPTNYHDVKLTYLTPDTFQIDAGSRVRSDDDTTDIIFSTDTIVDINVSGANGLDTGVGAIDTRYYLYAIYNPTTKTSALLLSTTNEAVSGSVVLPLDYTKKRQLRFDVINNSLGNFLPFNYYGDRSYIEFKQYVAAAPYLFLSVGSGAVTFWSPVTVPLASPNSRQAKLFYYLPWAGSVSASRSGYLSPENNSATPGIHLGIVSAQSGDQSSTTGEIDIALNASQQIGYAKDSNNLLNLSIRGYYITGVK